MLAIQVDIYYYIFWVTPLLASCLAMSVMYAHIFYVAAQQEARMLVMTHNLEQQQQQDHNYQRANRDRKYSKVSK